MLGIPTHPLPVRAQSQLKCWQDQIDSISDYAQKVAEGKAKFASRNKKRYQTFNTIKVELTMLCSGARRCMYCEDSYADEVEHVKTKDLYPEAVFVWENYLYACGPCNGPKNNHYAVFSRATGQKVNVTRQQGSPIIPPEDGDALLIDPRSENPLDYMMLDLQDTFYFHPTASLGSRDYERAEYTIELLRLNERDELIAARKEAYHNYRARVAEIVLSFEWGRSDEERERLVHAIRRMGHPTVWYEMKRQRASLPDLQELFASLPTNFSIT